MGWNLSPRFSSSKVESGKIEDFIDIYEDRISGWLLSPARSLLKIKDAGIAVTCLLVSYFEGFWQYRTGGDSRGKSDQFFRAAVSDVLPEITIPPGFNPTFDIKTVQANYLALVYADARCGLLHDGLIRKGILIGRAPSYLERAPMSISVHRDTGAVSFVLLDPEKLFEEIEKHHKRYCASLREGKDPVLRENFLRMWILRNTGGPSGAPAPPGADSGTKPVTPKGT
ncbi:MAG: hypothetical protein FD180_3456 [Planctomycetota bacterium]|nr:MAG: hypothetical protein FD180_3456 [Planctomycetota bacterium]